LSNHSQAHDFSKMVAMMAGGNKLGVPVGKSIDAGNRPIADALASCVYAVGLPTERLGPWGQGKFLSRASVCFRGQLLTLQFALREGFRPSLCSF
jgi:hypothetical protein